MIWTRRLYLSLVKFKSNEIDGKFNNNSENKQSQNFSENTNCLTT